VGARRAAALLAALLLAGCATVPPSDQRPMYGGEDRAANPELRDADAKLVADSVKVFGSPRAASDAFVSDGATAFRSGDQPSAMRFYNQAWLVDKDNPAVYWGFAAVLYQRDEYCESTRMLEAGAARGPMPPKVQAIGALVYAGCGITLAKFRDTDPSRYYARAEELLKQADADPSAPRATVLDAWARYYYGRGDYAAAWAKVAEYRRTVGKEIDPGFLASLRDKQSEPVPGPATPPAK
jgi:Tfp pilus assembly protein PilF